METIGMLIGWLVFGLIVGAIARFIHPGRDPMSWGGTLILGVVGSFVGGGIAYIFNFGTSLLQPANWIMSILGAVLLLAVVSFATKNRATT